MWWENITISLTYSISGNSASCKTCRSGWISVSSWMTRLPHKLWKAEKGPCFGSWPCLNMKVRYLFRGLIGANAFGRLHLSTAAHLYALTWETIRSKLDVIYFIQVLSGRRQITISSSDQRMNTGHVTCRVVQTPQTCDWDTASHLRLARH